MDWNSLKRFVPGDIAGRSRRTSRPVRWAKESGQDIRFAAKPFKPEIGAIPAEFARTIEETSCREALERLRAFQAAAAAAVADPFPSRP